MERHYPAVSLTPVKRMPGTVHLLMRLPHRLFFFANK